MKRRVTFAPPTREELKGVGGVAIIVFFVTLIILLTLRSIYG